LNHSKAIKRNTLQVSANKEYRKTEQLLVLSHTPQVKVDGPGRRRPKEDKDYWLEVKAEDRQEWSRNVEQTKTHPGL
jgi:hypothetical protein